MTAGSNDSHEADRVRGNTSPDSCVGGSCDQIPWMEKWQCQTNLGLSPVFNDNGGAGGNSRMIPSAGHLGQTAAKPAGQ
jgi:hypothetical protein